ncbi:MAG: LysR family transcriptional regulator [Cyanobacteria bacterium P01_H01_bin.121]
MQRKRSPFLNLSHLNVLLTVAQQQNFGEAALKLDMSQSAVSNAIATLEEQLGVILLSRGRHGANLTPAGEQLVEQAEQLLQLHALMLTEAKRVRGLQGGEVRVSTFRSALTHLMPEAIATFQKRYPDITIKIIEQLGWLEILTDLRKGRADVGFVDEPVGEEFDSLELLKDEYVLLLPPDHALAGKPLTWQDVQQQSLIMGELEDPCSQRLKRFFGQSELELEIAYQVGSDSAMVSMVQGGLGCSILPRLAAEPIPADVHVVSLPTPFFRSIQAITLANAMQTPAVYAFLEVLERLEYRNLNWPSGSRAPLSVAS